MSCDVGEATEGLENELTQVKRRKGLRMSCDVGKVTERLENEQSSFSNPSVASPTSQLILQPFFRFSYVTSSSLNSPGEPPMALGLLMHKMVQLWWAMLRSMGIFLGFSSFSPFSFSQHSILPTSYHFTFAFINFAVSKNP